MVCVLHKVGLSLIVDHSGNCFKRAGTKKVSLKDVESNKEAGAQVLVLERFAEASFPQFLCLEDLLRS